MIDDYPNKDPKVEYHNPYDCDNYVENLGEQCNLECTYGKCPQFCGAKGQCCTMHSGRYIQ